MYANIKPALILAMGECLAVSAAIDYDYIMVPGSVENAVRSFYSGNYMVEGLSVEDRILAYTIAFGGLILSYACDPVTPISRAHISIGLEIGGGTSTPGKLNDRDILRSWALIYSGEEVEGLSLLQGVSHYPEQVIWRPGGNIRVLPVAIRY